jgi:hypothetical protein
MKGEYVFGQSIKLKLMESHLDGEGMRGSGLDLLCMESAIGS